MPLYTRDYDGENCKFGFWSSKYECDLISKTSVLWTNTDVLLGLLLIDD